MDSDRIYGWIGFLVIVLVLLGVAGVVLGVSLLVYAGRQNEPLGFVGAALFFLQAALAFGQALRSLTR